MSANDRDPASVHPAELAGHMFGTSFRGFDQDEVREYLRTIAASISALHAERDELAARLAESEARVIQVADLDEDQLTAALGEETARVLATARHSAAEIRTNAEASVARLLSEAGEEAAATRSSADEHALTTITEADAYADATRTEADTAAKNARVAADDYATSVRTDADAAAEATRTEADEHATTVRVEADAAAATVRSDADAAAASTRADADAAAGTTRTEADAYAATTRTEADAAAAAARAEAEGHATTVRAEADASAAAITEEAAAAAATVRADADADAQRVKAEAEGLLEVRTAEAEAAAEVVRADAAEVLAEATRQAEAAIEAAKEEGRELVAEAQRMRERVLKDLARRRKASRLQLEQLRAARERLIEAYDLVRRTTDEATSELLVALPEARTAAMDAGRRAESEDEATVEELEAEIASARAAGLLPPPPPDVIAPEPVSEEHTDLESALGPPDAVLVETPDASDAEVVEDGPDDAGLEETAEIEVVAIDVVDPEVVEVDVAAIDVVDPEVVEVDVAAVDVVDLEVEEPAEAEVEDPEVEADLERAATAEPEAVEEPEPEADGGRDAEGRDPAEVDALFARLRAAREQPAEQGEAQHDAEPAAEPDPDPADEGDAPVALLERRDGMTEEIEHRLARRLKRVLADEQNSVLDAVRRSRKLPAAADVLPPLDEHEATYAVAVVDELAAAGAAGIAFQAGDDAAGIEVPLVDDIAESLAAELAGLVRPRIERSFEEVDGDEEELTALIRSGYREWKTQRIADVGRHHVLLAFSRGQFAALPEGAKVRWVIDVGGQACPDAEDNALAGTITKGEAFPTGDCNAPAHPGCRCLVVLSPP